MCVWGGQDQGWSSASLFRGVQLGKYFAQWLHRLLLESVMKGHLSQVNFLLESRETHPCIGRAGAGCWDICQVVSPPCHVTVEPAWAPEDKSHWDPAASLPTGCHLLLTHSLLVSIMLQSPLVATQAGWRKVLHKGHLATGFLEPG